VNNFILPVIGEAAMIEVPLSATKPICLRVVIISLGIHTLIPSLLFPSYIRSKNGTDSLYQSKEVQG